MSASDGEEAEDLGRRDVFSRIVFPTRGPACVRSWHLHRSASGRPRRRPCTSCRACWPPSGDVAAPGWRSWPPTTGSAPRRPIGICTRALTSSPPQHRGCAGALLAARAAGHSHVTVGGTLVRTDRCRVAGPTARADRPERRGGLW
jgi:hypothetical protein